MAALDPDMATLQARMEALRTAYATVYDDGNPQQPQQPQSKNAKKKARNVAMVVNYFDTTYGRNMDRLAAWQELCRDVGVDVGTSIRQCQKNLRGTYINIVDYVRAKERPEEGRQGFGVFDSAKALSAYIRKNKVKMFPRAEAKRNPILRWMLVQLC